MKLSSGNLKHQVYTVIKRKILMNEYKQGEHLEEKKLTEELEVSRTPVREALNALESEGFVETIPKKGTFVTTISIQSIKELFQIRHIMEPIALRLAIGYLDTDIIFDFKQKFNTGILNEDITLLHKLDYDFHDYIHSQCKNRYLIKFLQTSSNQFQRVRTQEFYSVERTIGGAKEHIQLIDYILAGSHSEAISYLEKHISSTEKYYFKSLIE